MREKQPRRHIEGVDFVIIHKQGIPIPNADKFIADIGNVYRWIYYFYRDYLSIVHLQRILDKVSEVGLYEYRIIMDLLSSIAYPSDALPVDEIASHIDMMVRKQVTSSVLR